MYVPELFYLCLYGEVVRAGARLELPLCPGHVVVGQPHCAMMATYSGVTNLATPGPLTADGLHRSYVAMRLDIEASHTLFASLTK